MKNYKWLLLSFFLIAGFASCTKNDDTPKSVEAKGIYIVNYGKFGESNGGICIYDEENKQMTTTTAYKDANGVLCGSNLQSVGSYNGKLYFMSNGGDKIDIVDAETMKAAAAPIADDIIKPRYFAAKGDYGYASCIGGDEFKVVANGYIAKIDLQSNTLAKKIPLDGGAEGLIIVGNKLYCAVYAKNKVAVLDLDTDEFTYIETKAMPKQLVVDADNNVWVSVVSTYYYPYAETEVGVQRINTTTNVADEFINFSGMGSNGYIHMAKDQKTIYAMGAEAWPGTQTTIVELDTETKTAATEALISGESFYSFGYNKASESIYVCISTAFDGTPGKLKVYSKTGELIDEQATGAAPIGVTFNYE